MMRMEMNVNKAMNLRAAMNLHEISDVVLDGAPGATLPSSLSDEWLNAAIHDLHQYFRRDQDADSQGNLYLTGPMYLLRKVLADKDLRVPEASVLELLHHYLIELEIESIIRLYPGVQIERATLLTIFEPSRDLQIRRAFEPQQAAYF